MAKKGRVSLDTKIKDKAITKKDEAEESEESVIGPGEGKPSTQQLPLVEAEGKSISTQKPAHTTTGLNRDGFEMLRYPVLVVLTIVTLATRLYKIEEPDHICWDETHFGKMGSWYIKNEFFFDVHPPLAKMMIGLSGMITGYNGTFPFGKPGDKYGDNTQFLGMRVICAIVGSLVVPLCYETVFLLTTSIMAASLTALLLILDPGMITISQYILLDQWLLFGIMLSVVGITRFKTYASRPFSTVWWGWLVFTGVAIASAMSMKFVGLFVILYVGFHTVSDLWTMLGNLSLSMKHITKEFVARALCLILLPMVVYTSFFFVHFRILYKSGNGDGFFSSAFQSQLVGNKLNNASMPAQIAYGSIVTIKNYRTGGSYLHSHHHLYPEEVGPKQQQVTTYSHKDENNKWMIKKADIQPQPDDTVEYVKSGDSIRLEHIGTKRNLHSHNEKAPITKSQKQVSCYGANGTGDANDVFRIQSVNEEAGTVIHTVISRFQLIHPNAKCVVKSHSVKLPKWGWDQNEVTCNTQMKDSNSYWNIEEVEDSRMPNESFQVFAPSFISKFLEAHAVMLQGNAGLKPKEGEITSRPWEWPLNIRGQRFSGGDHRVYLLGNPVIWWCNTACIPLFGLVYLYYAVRAQRGYRDDPVIEETRERTFTSCLWLLVGWALHYLPFWMMGRVLYFHHYFPALLFNSMFTGVFIEYMVKASIRVVPKNLAWNVYHMLVGVLLSTILYSFYLFYPLSYGMSGPTAENVNSTMYGLKWLDSWEI